MKKLLLWLALGVFSTGAALAQNIVGTWQGTLPAEQGRPALRLVLKLSRADDEKLKGVFYSIDQNGQPINTSSVTQQGAVVKVGVASIGGDYEGKLEADGNSIVGTWRQGPQGIPLTLARATDQTAWAIPEPPPPPKMMAATVNPSFDVSTIKPSKPGAPGKSILVGRGGGNLFTTTNSSLSELIAFAYGIHAKQLVGAPAWADNELYDITGKPDQEGMPSVAQLQTMVQKLLKERFQLAFHRDKKELSAYVLTVAKTGLKLKKTENSNGNLPGFGGRGPGNIGVRNSTMADFAGFLQARIVDRPVLDQTGLTDRYDFTLKWTPDAAPNGVPGQNAPPPAPVDADTPDLFGALQQQLGIKLESAKAPVDVIVIDKAEKPSDN